MSLISNGDLRKLIKEGVICIKPDVPDGNIQPASIDLRLGCQVFRSSDKKIINLEKGESVELRPGELAIAMTLEELELPLDIAGKIGLRSKFTRQGLLLLSGPQIDPGYKGRLFLTLINLSGEPIFITCGEEIITLELFTLSSKSSGYKGDYKYKVKLDYKDTEPIRKGGYLYKINEIKESLELSNTIQKFFIPILLFALSVLMVVVPLLIFILQEYSNELISKLFILHKIENLQFIVLAELAFLLFIIIIKLLNIQKYFKLTFLFKK